jgi:hypothetical protein
MLALAKINSYLGFVTKFKKWVIWTYFQPRTYRDSKPGIAKLYIRVWMVDYYFP